MELYLVRHGESEIPPDTFQSDFPLSDLGRKQATAVAGRFRDISIDHLLTTLSLGAISLPEFVTGTLLILLISQWLGLLPGVSLIPIQITVDGSYFAIDEYLYKLETLPRLSNVLTVGLQVGPGAYPQLELAITSNFFTRAYSLMCSLTMRLPSTGIHSSGGP